MSLNLLTNDLWYYKSNLDNIKKRLNYPDYLKNIDVLYTRPSRKEVDETFALDNVAYLSEIKLDTTNLIITKMLPNTQEQGTKTYQQVLYSEDINTELYNRFGMSVSNPTLNFNDLGGFEEPKANLIKNQKFVQKGLVQKNLSIFLGVSRSGKSFFAECLAGELKYKLILLDLGVILASGNPPEKLDSFFKYLENIDDYVLLIDEIEKVVDPDSSNSMSKVMLGKLLTIFNDFNAESGFNIKDNFVIATANNITTLLHKNPEFINRFGLKYFVGYPDKETFINVSNYYLQKLKVKGITGTDIFNVSSTLYVKDEIPKMSNISAKRFGKYANGEIKELIANLLLFCEERNEELFCDLSTLKILVSTQKPQIQFAKKGVINTIEAAKIANFKET